jgi:hypothetical protein
MGNMVNHDKFNWYANILYFHTLYLLVKMPVRCHGKARRGERRFDFFFEISKHEGLHTPTVIIYASIFIVSKYSTLYN